MVNLQDELAGLLSSTEEVIMTLRQSHISSITPAYAVMTNSHIIKVHFSFWHYYTGIRILSTSRKSMVPYRNITAALLRKGNFLSSVEIKTKDIQNVEGGGQSVTVDGLRTEQAEKFVKIINQLIIINQIPPSIAEPPVISLGNAIEYCKKTGGKIIWLGFEDKESVASVLSIPHDMIQATTLSKLLDMDSALLEKLHNCILLGYTTPSTSTSSKLLKLELQFDCPIVEGGLINNVPRGRTLIRHPRMIKHEEYREMSILHRRKKQ